MEDFNFDSFAAQCGFRISEYSEGKFKKSYDLGLFSIFIEDTDSIYLGFPQFYLSRERKWKHANALLRWPVRMNQLEKKLIELLNYVVLEITEAQEEGFEVSFDLNYELSRSNAVFSLIGLKWNEWLRDFEQL